jgi:hypothetical protein
MNHDAGGIHDAINTPHGGCALFDGTCDRYLLRHIRIGSHAASLSSDLGQSFAVAVEQRQQGTFRRKQLGGSPPDPGRGARDQDPPALETSGMCR